MTTYKSIWRCDNVADFGEHVTCFVFLVDLFSFHFILGIALSTHWWTDFEG